MVIKRRKLRAKHKSMTPLQALKRMGDIAEHFDRPEFAEIYINSFHKSMLSMLQSIAARAERERNWDFMDGAFKQATELYVLASVLYEKFPEHIILSDGAFDGLARWLLKHRGKIDKDFLTWYNVTAMGLKAGTGYNVAAKEPIPQYVYLLTGKRIQEDNGVRTKNKTRLLRGNTKSRVKTREGGCRGNSGQSVRRIKKLRKHHNKSKTSS